MTLRKCQDRPGISPWHLARASIARSAQVPPWQQLCGSQVVFTHQARIGIAALCHHWQIGAGDEILAPAYNCGTEIDALCHSGARIRFYRVDERAAIDLDDLYARVTDRTRMVYVIHYFGWPQELADLACWCRHRDIRLVEDCALSLFSCSPTTQIGMAGDAAVFSFPKTLAVPDGGALVLRRSQFAVPLPMRAPPVRQIARKTAGLARNWLVDALSPVAGPQQDKTTTDTGRWDDSEQPKLSQPDMPVSYYYDECRSDWGMSRITAWLLRHTDVTSVVMRRRRNYSRLQCLLNNVKGIQPLYESLPEGVCPLAYPLVVTNRRQWVSFLRDRGIDAISWWEGHHQLFKWDEFAEAHDLKMHVLALPVHHDLSEKHMDYIAASVLSSITLTGELVKS